MAEQMILKTLFRCGETCISKNSIGGGVTMKDVHDNTEKMFAGVSLLRRRLSADGRLEVAHSGNLWTAAFEWFPPTSTDIILETQGQLGKTLPKDYASFLSSVSNGAVMFFDVQYGQWGFKIYGARELLEKQRFWQHSLEGKWKSHFIAFAENFGDEYVMVFDLERPTSDVMSYTVVQGSPYDPVAYWLAASRSFHEWLDHLVTAQGAKYWEWR
jgi:hypothetical protein